MKSFPRNVSYEDIVKETSEKVFTFDDNILPSEARNIILNMVRKNGKAYFGENITADQLEQMKNLYEELYKRIVDYGAKMQAFEYSTGGSKIKSDNDKNQSSRIVEKGATTEYTIISVPNKKNKKEIVLIEAVGQKNNATFIGEKNENKEKLERAISELGRTEVVKSGALKKVIHNRNGKESGYNFESGHLLKLIDCAYNNPDELMEIVNKKNGCQLKTILDGVEFITNTDNAVKQMKLNKEEHSIDNNDGER